jgi:hypothetical protein
VEDLSKQSPVRQFRLDAFGIAAQEWDYQNYEGILANIKGKKFIVY